MDEMSKMFEMFFFLHFNFVDVKFVSHLKSFCQTVEQTPSCHCKCKLPGSTVRHPNDDDVLSKSPFQFDRRDMLAQFAADLSDYFWCIIVNVFEHVYIYKYISNMLCRCTYM